MLDVSFYYLLHYSFFFDTGSLTEHGIIWFKDTSQSATPHICIFLSTTVAGAWPQSLVFLWLLGNHTQICMLAEHVLCWLSHTTPGNSVCIFSKKMLTLAFFSAVILLWESTKRSPLRQTQSLSSLPPCLSGSNYTSRLFSPASELSLLIPYPAPLWNVTFSVSLLSFLLPFSFLFPPPSL